MILPGNASLILSTAQQMLKLGGRIDRLMAQKTATQSQLVLGMPQVRLGNAAAQRALAARTLAATLPQDPDPFAADRTEFATEAAAPTPRFDVLFAKYFPDEVAKLTFSPDDAYLDQLKQAFPTVAWHDLSVRIAAFTLSAGPDQQQIGYTGRIALAVADTILEFGAENTALFVRDPKLQGVARSVLQRLAAPEWDQFDSWNPLLQTALRVTLNAALDHADQLALGNPWLDGVLEALVQTRPAAPNPDDFLLGLIQGKGVPLLISRGLLVASARLEVGKSTAFKQVAAEVLQTAAPFVLDQTNPSLSQFFKDHWGDLLRAGLTSLDQHGDQLLHSAQPLLNGVLTAMVRQLARTPDAGFFTNDTLCRVTATAIGVVAANPGELPGLEHKPWLRDFIAAAATSAQKLTARNLFTRDAADALLADAIDVLAQHPALVAGNTPVTLTLTSAIFDALAQVPQLTRASARSLGETSLRAALEALAQDPQLISTKFAFVVESAATQLAGWVGRGTVTSDQAAALAATVIATVARNPQLYAGAPNGVAGAVLTAVQQAFPAGTPWAARLFVATARETLIACGRAGGSPTAPTIGAQLQQLLTTVLTSGLQVAQTQLGQSIDLAGIPPVLGGLVAQALRGDLTAFDPASLEFIAAFKSLASKIA